MVSEGTTVLKDCLRLKRILYNNGSLDKKDNTTLFLTLEITPDLTSELTLNYVN